MAILVTGATGSVGRHVVDGLLAAGEKVRVLTRDPGKANLPADVELVTADLDAPVTLTAELFAGIDSVFVFPANVGVAELVERASAAGIGRFVVLSSLAAAQEHPRDVGSASALHHLAIEEAVTGRTDGWAIVRPGTFANNLLSWSHNVRAGYPIRAPYVASAQAPIHEADVADAIVALLLDFESHRSEVFPITGPQALTRTEQVTTIGAAVGKHLPLVEISAEEFREEMSQFIPGDIISMLLDYWSDTITKPDVVRSVHNLTGKEGRTLAQWAADHRADFTAES